MDKRTACSAYETRPGRDSLEHVTWSVDFGELQEEGLQNVGFVFSAEQREPSEPRKVTPREIERQQKESIELMP